MTDMSDDPTLHREMGDCSLWDLLLVLTITLTVAGLSCHVFSKVYNIKKPGFIEKKK